MTINGNMSDPTPWELARRLDKQDTTLERIELKIDRVGAVEARLDSQDARMDRIEKAISDTKIAWPQWVGALGSLAAVVVALIALFGR